MTDWQGEAGKPHDRIHGAIRHLSHDADECDGVDVAEGIASGLSHAEAGVLLRDKQGGGPLRGGE